MALFRPQRVNLASRGIRKIFGDCETMILGILWEGTPLPVRDVQRELKRHKHAVSFNATMTVLNRLVEKGMVKKHKSGGVFLYAPILERAVFLDAARRDILRSMVRDRELFSAAAFVDVLEDLSAKDRAALMKILGKRRQ